MSTFSDRIAALPPEKRLELERRLMAMKTAAGGAIEKRHWTGPAPLSFAQERLWFLDSLLPGTPLYSMPVAFDLEGQLDVDALRRAVDLLVARHASLRTTYRAWDGDPYQAVEPAMTAEFRSVDVGGTEDGELDRALRCEAARPFDLTRDAVLRVAVFRRESQRHLLFVNMPHIAGDGWSYSVFFRELGHLYGAPPAGRFDTLPPLPIDYRDFAAWQRAKLQGEPLDRELAYWKERLSAADTLELPLDRPRPRSLAWRGACEQVTVPAAVSASVAELSRKHFATPFMAWLTGCFLLLHEWTGAEDLLIGTPSANRSRLELEGVVGLFVNTLLLRAEVARGQTFAGLLDQVRQRTIEAQQHQELPFEKIVSALQPTRQWNREPFLRVMFSYAEENFAFSLPGLNVKWRHIDSETAKFDLQFHVHRRPEGLGILVTYRTDLFLRGTIRRILEQYVSLIEVAVQNPDQDPGTLGTTGGSAPQPAASAPEPRQRGYPQTGVPHLFEAQVGMRPEAVAISMGSVRVSYGELNRRANRLAHVLIGLGAAPETCVGLMLPRSLEAIVAMLGVLKSGAAYVPLDPDYPIERLNLLASDCGLRWVVTERRYAAQVPTAVTPVFAGDPTGANDSNPDVAMTPDTLACILYTSGSTGRPKGVEVLHRGIVRLLFGGDYARFGPDEVLLHAAPLTFDAATFEIWGALLHGGRCAIHPEGPQSVEELGASVREHGVTTMWLTAALFNLVIDDAAEALSGVRQLLAGGEALSVAHVRRALERLPGTVLINGYGPTEGTTFTCCYRIPHQLPDGIASIPIGRPIANTEVYVLDQRGEPAPSGVPGELYIGGDGVARGYVNREDSTRERFLPNRFTGRGKLYRSGDLVRFLPDGNLEFLGRLDNQVKIRGYRIEPGEVESVLVRHPKVRSAAVMAEELGSGDRCLVAYVAANANCAALVPELREFLHAQLPAYMIPARIVPVDRMPLKPNGKLDRSALPAFAPAVPPPREPAAADETERKIAAIWKELLKSECPDVEADFFEMGGDSLLAMRIAARMNEAFGRKVPLAALMQNPTIRGMANLLRAGFLPESNRPLVTIQTQGSKRPLFGVHDVRGQILLFSSLSAHFGPDQPVYALQPRGLQPARGPFPTIEEMAARYVREMRTVQPAGPYRLAGACFGGVVAFEMARQLESEGERVEFLGLIDAFAPGALERLPGVRDRALARLQGLGKSLALHTRYLARLGPVDSLAYLLGVGRTLKRRVLDRLWVWRHRLLRIGGGANGLETDVFERAGYCAIKSYLPKPYHGSAVLFRAQERSALSQDLKGGWDEVIRGDVEVCEIPGDHLTMLSHPNRSVLAKELARRLDRDQCERCCSLDQKLRAF